MRHILSNRGFTLIELILIITLLGSLGTVGLTKFYDYHESAEISAELKAVADLNSAIVIYGSESFTTKRMPLYPSVLDLASPGEASPENPLFSEILTHPMTRDWEKVDPYHYKGPTGTEYLYDAAQGQFVTTESDPYALYGNITGETSMLLAFDSGTLISLYSDLAYVPSLDSGTVEAILSSGIRVVTDANGGATVTLLDGTEMYIEDIASEYTSIISDYTWSPDGMEFSSEYAYVGYERALEGDYQTTYHQRNQDYDEATNTYTYNYEYDTTGSSSQVGLSPTNGYLWESEYHTDSPSTYTSSYSSSEDGGYSGTYQSSHDTSTFSNFGRSSSESGFGYTINSDSNGDSQLTYSYDASTEIYSSQGAGSNRYTNSYEYLDGQTYEYSDNYNYDNSYTYNRGTGSYAGRGTYAGERRNYTYNYSYEASAGTYIYTYTDNNSGSSWTYTNQRGE